MWDGKSYLLELSAMHGCASGVVASNLGVWFGTTSFVILRKTKAATPRRWLIFTLYRKALIQPGRNARQRHNFQQSKKLHMSKHNSTLMCSRQWGQTFKRPTSFRS